MPIHSATTNSRDAANNVSTGEGVQKTSQPDAYERNQSNFIHINTLKEKIVSSLV